MGQVHTLELSYPCNLSDCDLLPSWCIVHSQVSLSYPGNAQKEHDTGVPGEQ